MNEQQAILERFLAVASQYLFARGTPCPCHR